jgi:hypothetical protein
MKAALAFVGAAACLNGALAQGREHPLLPDDWNAYVDEPQVGKVWESYTMVSSPDYSYENPSGTWTNYSSNPENDGSCKRLIHVPNNYDGNRFYLNCYSLDCCYDLQSGNHVEFQIPNVHSITGRPWPVDDLGKENVTTSFGETYEADVWAWSFTAQTFKAYTFPDETSPTGVKLVRWYTALFGTGYTTDYTDYKSFAAEEDLAAHKATFTIPQQCQRNNLFRCGKAAELAGEKWVAPKDPKEMIAPSIWVDENGNQIDHP